jgi:hypothetical protein
MKEIWKEERLKLAEAEVVADEVAKLAHAPPLTTPRTCSSSTHQRTTPAPTHREPDRAMPRVIIRQLCAVCSDCGCFILIHFNIHAHS